MSPQGQSHPEPCSISTGPPLHCTTSHVRPEASPHATRMTLGCTAQWTSHCHPLTPSLGVTLRRRGLSSLPIFLALTPLLNGMHTVWEPLRTTEDASGR